MEASLTSKGQATIPKAVRDHLHLEPGDRVKFFLHPDGSVVILPKVPTAALKGMISSPRGERATSNTSVVSIEEMNEAVEAGSGGQQRMSKIA